MHRSTAEAPLTGLALPNSNLSDLWRGFRGESAQEGAKCRSGAASGTKPASTRPQATVIGIWQRGEAPRKSENDQSSSATTRRRSSSSWVSAIGEGASIMRSVPDWVFGKAMTSRMLSTSA